MISPTESFRRNRYAFVTAGHHFLLNVLPLREPDSSTALASFTATIAYVKLSSPHDVDAVLLRCLAVLDAYVGKRIPSLVEQYLFGTRGGSDAVSQFTTCVEDLVRYHAITDGAVQEAMQFILSHYAEPGLNPQVVASHTGVRLNTLDVAFRTQLKHTISAHIRGIRLDRAAMLLATTNRTIKEVWVAVGYNHHSNFDHDFKRRFAASPRRFRELSVRPVAQSHYGPMVADHKAVERISEPPNHRVLIVDDDQGTRETLSTYLRYEGHNVSVAASGAEGLELAGVGAPHVILLDYHLQDMEGVHFLKALRHRGLSQQPAVALFTADWEVFDLVDEVHALNAIIASKLCDIEAVNRLIVYLASE